jgi:hypothetical protein
MPILSKGTTFATGDQVTALKLNNLVDNATFGANIVDGSTLTTSGSGTSATILIRDLGVSTAKIAANAVTTAKIADANVTTVKILDANVTTAKIADSNVTTAKIADLNVTTGKIADSAVTTAKIADANITAAKLSGAQSGSAPILGARAFVAFDATRNSSGGTDSANTARFIYGSKNVTSVTKVASGQFRVAITTAMPDTNYCVVCNTATTNSPRWAGVNPSSLTTAQFDIYTETQDNVAVNQEYVSAVVFG